MSIALESNTSNQIERSGYGHGMSYISIYDSQEAGRPVAGIFAGDRLLPDSKMTKNVVQEREEELGSCSSSSIGRNSDSSGLSSDGDDVSGEGEVQSSYKGPFDTLDSLEEVLPIKRGISKFYCGKSKSFTSLTDASSCSSVKDIAKPENAYTRKRKNLLAYNHFWDENRNYPLRSTSGGISKRPAKSRSTLALAVTMSSSDSNNNSENSSNSSSPLCLPPLYPHSRRSSNNESSTSPPQRKFSPRHSLSLSDLQCAAALTPGTSSLVISNGDEDKRH
ncbi:hypothetical protein F0562_029784 [Nyssa sinensis]|uniref:Uncharacterized protein n=1 Tax=Nyssa sinensis TaxID=561372 RepID=A0A5J5AWN8_9ASTE|nr:hypothetical protein F0562_029784 [Nyssa sinensis]